MEHLEITTRSRCEMIDITAELRALVRRTFGIDQSAGRPVGRTGGADSGGGVTNERAAGAPDG